MSKKSGALLAIASAIVGWSANYFVDTLNAGRLECPRLLGWAPGCVSQSVKQEQFMSNYLTALGDGNYGDAWAHLSPEYQNRLAKEHYHVATLDAAKAVYSDYWRQLGHVVTHGENHSVAATPTDRRVDVLFFSPKSNKNYNYTFNLIKDPNKGFLVNGLHDKAEDCRPAL